MTPPHGFFEAVAPGLIVIIPPCSLMVGKTPLRDNRPPYVPVAWAV
jgi:hypothetical protein